MWEMLPLHSKNQRLRPYEAVFQTEESPPATFPPPKCSGELRLAVFPLVRGRFYVKYLQKMQLQRPKRKRPHGFNVGPAYRSAQPAALWSEDWQLFLAHTLAAEWNFNPLLPACGFVRSRLLGGGLLAFEQLAGSSRNGGAREDAEVGVTGWCSLPLDHGHLPRVQLTNAARLTSAARTPTTAHAVFS